MICSTESRYFGGNRVRRISNNTYIQQQSEVMGVVNGVVMGTPLHLNFDVWTPKHINGNFYLQ